MRGLKRPSPALVVACLALLVSLSGTSYATVLNVPLNSVGTPQLKNGAVTAPKLRNGSVGTAKLATGAVGTAKLKNGAVTLAKLAPNARIPGPPGPPGPQGPPGDGSQIPDGAITAAKLASGSVTAPKLVTTTASNSVVVNAGSAASVGVTCPGGGKVVGGGAAWIGTVSAAQAEHLHIVHSYPSLPSSWGVRAYNGLAANRSIFAYAVCVPAG